MNTPDEKQKGRSEREAQRLLKWKESNRQQDDLEKLNLPVRIKNDLKNIPFPEIDSVKSSYLYGKAGSGKTIRAVFLTLADLKNGYIKEEYPRTQKAMFVSVPDLILKFKSLYSNKNNDVSEEDLVDLYSKVDLLVMDDFGVEKTTDWSFQLLYIIINRRYENMKKTIFTSNLSLKQIAEKLGDDRLPSRIQQMCEIVFFKGKNYRTE